MKHYYIQPQTVLLPWAMKSVICTASRERNVIISPTQIGSTGVIGD